MKKRFLDVLVKSNFATPTPFGSVSCFVVGVCLSSYNLNLFLIHQASYSKEYQWHLIHSEVFGSIWKIGRYPIKVSEVLLCTFNKYFLIFRAVELRHFFPSEMLRECLVCVICNSSSFHSFIFKLCIMIVHSLKMYTLYFYTFDNTFLSVKLRNC